MEFYVALGLATAAITALAAVLFLKTRHVGFPVGVGLLYYWSLYGAWSIVTDKLGGDSGKRYDYLTEKMFAIDLDRDYFQSLLLYAVFIVLIEMTVLCLLEMKGEPDHRRAVAPIRISHPFMIVLSGVALLFSFLIIGDQLTSATEMNISAYVATRGGLGEYHPLYTIHQILNRVAAYALALGLATYLAGNTGRFLAGSRSLSIGCAYIGLLLSTFGFLAVLGNKNELFSALLLGGIFYLTNTKKVHWGSALPIGLVLFLAIGAINFLRSLPVLALLDSDTWWEAVAQAPDIRSSNEAFAAHFSLYGVLHFNAPFTYGSSLTALAMSVVPRLYWPDRPEGTYVQYAESLGIYEGATGQGYTVHHATGWYLNFGLWGFMVGAILWGAIWAMCFNSHTGARIGDRGWKNILAIVAPAGFISAMPPFIRAGPDAYKGLVIEAFVIPTLIVLVASVRWNEILGPSGRASGSVKQHSLGE
jgi:hypothetical protein